MSSARFNRLMNDAYLNDDKEFARSVYNEWQVANCYYPQKVRIYDAHTQTKRLITIGCGRCYHCIESKINEWCTRMYAHAEDFKNIYFVTLTYRSFVAINSPVSRLILNKLQDAIWHQDAYNSTKHFSYNPCLLIKAHYQNFLKRLRKNTGLNDLTFVLSGEYGSEYGRPHFHMILFTNGELTQRDIIRAWSVCLWRSASGEWSYRRHQSKNGLAFDAPIGHIDFHNLVTNGTFNTTIKIKIDGTYMNAANCFAYVCKYVCKRDHINYCRVSLAHRACFHKEKRFAVYQNDYQFSQVQKWLQDCGYSFELQDATYNSLKQFIYEKISFTPDQYVYQDSLNQFKRTSLFGHEYDLEVYPAKYFDFRKRFTPFCEFSRGTPIGSIYAQRNIQEFTEGVFTKPLLQTSGFVVPSYFRAKASHFKYGLRKLSKTIKGTSYNLSPLLDLLGRFESSANNPVSLREHFDRVRNRETFETAIRSDRHVFANIYTGERILLQGNFAVHYKYDRSAREYAFTRSVPLSAWIRHWTLSLKQELERYRIDSERSRIAAKDRESALLKMEDMGVEYIKNRDSFIERSKRWRDLQQNFYTELHYSVE